ncbi:glycosyltransferase [Chloroflexota bacterium]
MKVLQVIPYFVPAWGYGGPLPVCYGLSKELVQRGHEVTVYTTDALNAKNRIEMSEEIIDKIKVKRFKTLSNTLAYNHNIFFSPGMISMIRNNLKYFDIVHVHEYRTLQNTLIHRYAKKYNIPYLLQAHGSLPRIAVKQKLKKLFDMLWGYKLLRDASKVIALTEIEAEQYKSMGVSEDKIEIVPNGVDLSEFESLPERGEFRRKYGLDNNQKLVLYLGRIHETKGLDLLVKAFANLPKDFNDVKLVIAGPDDGYRLTLKKLIKELGIEGRVLSTGPLYEEEKIKAYVDADVFVTPSFYGFPVTFLEACACGLPIITTTQAQGRLDWLDSQAGLTVSYDKDQLGEAISRILNNDKMRREFGEKGKLLVREQFNWCKIAQKMEQVYLSCLPLGE